MRLLEKENRALKKMVVEQQSALLQFELANKSMGLALLMGTEAGEC